MSDHTKRINELLEANNRYLEEARAARRELKAIKEDLPLLIEVSQDYTDLLDDGVIDGAGRYASSAIGEAIVRLEAFK